MTEAQAREILGVTAPATVEEIRSRYRTLARETHPDTSHQTNAVAFVRVVSAYEKLLSGVKETSQDPFVFEKPNEPEPGDFEWEWQFREKEIRSAFAELRKRYEAVPPSTHILEQLELLIQGYETKQELRKRLSRDSRRIAQQYFEQLEQDLQSSVTEVAVTFNTQVYDCYFPLYERVMIERLHHRYREQPFLLALALGAGLFVPTLAIAGEGSLGITLGVGLVGATLFAGLTSHFFIARSTNTAIVQVVPRGVLGFASGLEAPEELTKGEGLALGGGLLGLDVLLDGDLEAFGLVGLGIAALALLFAPSLDEVKERTLAELEEQVNTKLLLDEHVREYLSRAESSLLAAAREVARQSRMQAIAATANYSKALIGYVDAPKPTTDPRAKTTTTFRGWPWLVAAITLAVGVLGGTLFMQRGRWLRAHPQVEAVSPASNPQRVYLVKPGDTLGKIGAAHGVSIPELLSANPLDNPDVLHPGMKLTIPEH